MNTPTIRKGMKVRGLGRGERKWSPQPIGTVTRGGSRYVRVAWDGTCVEDDMLPTEIAIVR